MSAEVCHDDPVQPAAIEEAFREHRGFLWGLCYRLSGNAADADELVQETFVRALERPPADLERPWRPWLTRVAVNLGRDLLRRRRRRTYVGPWLPGPVPTAADGLPCEPVDPAPGPGARYDRLESVTVAFLLALEALSPAQRAVLLLRDVFDYSVRETADALAMSEANVKTTHLRARRVMESYDRRRVPVTAARRSRPALEQFPLLPGPGRRGRSPVHPGAGRARHQRRRRGTRRRSAGDQPARSPSSTSGWRARPAP